MELGEAVLPEGGEPGRDAAGHSVGGLDADSRGLDADGLRSAVVRDGGRAEGVLPRVPRDGSGAGGGDDELGHHHHDRALHDRVAVGVPLRGDSGEPGGVRRRDSRARHLLGASGRELPRGDNAVLVRPRLPGLPAQSGRPDGGVHPDEPRHNGGRAHGDNVELGLPAAFVVRGHRREDGRGRRSVLPGPGALARDELAVDMLPGRGGQGPARGVLLGGQVGEPEPRLVR
ncbi:MAG: hypothetical protein DRN08_05395 [Thermoplasmata archaeon]|nr:MAG: hypothetical protein DRN08_05395 [Thermoplasmata archaeon]